MSAHGEVIVQLGQSLTLKLGYTPPLLGMLSNTPPENQYFQRLTVKVMVARRGQLLRRNKSKSRKIWILLLDIFGLFSSVFSFDRNYFGNIVSKQVFSVKIMNIVLSFYTILFISFGLFYIVTMSPTLYIPHNLASGSFVTKYNCT